MEIKTNIELLNEISAKLGGKSDASVLVEGLNNIANALGDTDPDQMVTVSQALETVLDHMDGGGGGGDGVLNHPLTLTITNNYGDNIFPPGEILVKDKLIVDVDMEPIAPGETNTISLIVPAFDTGGEYPELAGKAMLNIPNNYQVSNMVNCHTTEFDDDPYIEIDDITKSSSADINVVPDE